GDSGGEGRRGGGAAAVFASDRALVASSTASLAAASASALTAPSKSTRPPAKRARLGVVAYWSSAAFHLARTAGYSPGRPIAFFWIALRSSKRRWTSASTPAFARGVTGGDGFRERMMM